MTVDSAKLFDVLLSYIKSGKGQTDIGVQFPTSNDSAGNIFSESLNSDSEDFQSINAQDSFILDSETLTRSY